jgi:hypothetical protein
MPQRATANRSNDLEHAGGGARGCLRERTRARRCVAEGEGAAMRRFALLVAVPAVGALLSACGVAPVQTLKVPIPVECRAEMPARPAMPTETLAPGVDLDRFAASALAEIEIREGYEGELRVALEACIKPWRLTAH